MPTTMPAGTRRVGWAALLLCGALSSPPAAADDASPTTPAATPEVAANVAPGATTRPGDGRVQYALALRFHGLFVPAAFLSSFLAQYQSLNSGSVGAELIRRKGRWDVFVGAEVSFYNFPDGNWLSSLPDKTAELDTHYARFKNLGFFSVDVGVVYNYDVASWMALSFGAGLGVGLTFGDIYVVNDTGAVNGGTCTTANAGSTAGCYPVVNPSHYPGGGPTYTDGTGVTRTLAGPIHVGDPALDPDWERKLDGLAKSQQDCLAKRTADDCKDTAGHPYYHAASEKPPAMLVINLLVGFKFRLHRHLNLNLRVGFRNGLVVGGGPEFVF